MEIPGVTAALSENARKHPNHTAVLEPVRGKRLTYNELNKAVDRTARRLNTAGIRAGQRIPLLMETRLKFVIATLAIIKLGGVAVPLNSRQSRREHQQQLERVEPEGIIVDGSFEERARSIHDGEPVLSMERPKADEIIFLDRLKTGSPIQHSANKNDDAVVMFTSGTTGEAKAVRITHENLASHARASTNYFELTDEDTWMAPLPMYHMGGFGPIVRCLSVGGTILLQDYEFPAVLDTLRAFDATALSLIPAQLRRLLKHPSVFPPDQLRFLLLGGAPIPPELIKQCREKKIPLYGSYGTTETTSHVAVAEPAEMFDHPDDPGARPVQSAQVRVELTDNLKVQSEETGEIVINGPMVSPGYLDAPERNQQQFDDRGFHTGDVGRFDSNGRVHVHGRMDDMIISGGELVAPEEIQSVLCDHSKVKDVAVVELSSDKWGTVAGALVRRSENEFPDPEELRNYCRERLADYKIPKKWIIRDQIPQTKSGKIDRQTIKDDLKTA